MNITEEKLKELLVDRGYITEAQFHTAKEIAREEQEALDTILVKEGIISDEHLGTLIANERGFRFINLRNEDIDEHFLAIVPDLVIKLQRVIVFGRTDQGLKVAMANPDDYEMQNWLEKKTGEKILIYYATPRDIGEALTRYRKEKEEFKEVIKRELEKAGKEEVQAEDVPIIRIIDMILDYAYENDASDIHIEPFEDKTVVRYRIDGILHNVVSLPKKIHDLLVTRIKVLSKLRTDEHFSSQDGRFSVLIGPDGVTTNIEEFKQVKQLGTEGGRSQEFDVRVSIIPVTEGENVVMRLLSEKARRYNIEDLGLEGDDLERVKKNIKKSHGMVLTTGPTGCGKTTTIYALLKILNRPEVKIASIEDPVEYDIDGVGQIQVNPKTSLTFALGLRSIVRQDPDIIFVGEIRDKETANIAINSAMTGHIVLSTMHANTAATNLPRLMDMDIEPFLIASSVNVIIAQRLVRKICLKCRESYKVDIESLEGKFDKKILQKYTHGKKQITVYRGKGCAVCHDVGYVGRMGVFEVLEIDDNVRELIMKKTDAYKIEERAVKDGMTLMIEDGLRKVLNGVTTVEEVLRVTSE